MTFHVLTLSELYDYCPGANDGTSGYAAALGFCFRKMATNGYEFVSTVQQEDTELFVFKDEQGRSMIW